jgi:tRNA 5-methylaminomethyl-2-thiouridine biosynthesis bifunctional protein
MDEWKNLDLGLLNGRVAFRCTLPDYLPAVGPVADEDAMLQRFAPLRKNARAFIPDTGKYLPGLYINVGHGSRGLAYTPLCAEILAAHINCEPPPLARELLNALNPARFLIRDLIKNKR